MSHHQAEYYIGQCEAYVSRLVEIPESLGRALIKSVEAKLVKDKSKPKEPKQDGSKRNSVAHGKGL